MTQYERMVKGLVYDPGDPEIMNEQVPFMDKQWGFNQLKPSDYEKKQEYMREVFAECGENCYIELPLRANWGGRHLHLGSGIYINTGFTLVDDGHIYVGDKVMFGPNVIITTANHPEDQSRAPERAAARAVRQVPVAEAALEASQAPGRVSTKRPARYR